MKLELDIHPTKCSPDAAGEAIMYYINPDDRWGYWTREMKCPNVIESNVNIEEELIEATLCCGCFAKSEYKRISKHILEDHSLAVYLYWDGDGTIVIKHLDEGWMLYNGDMKKPYEWEWVEEDNWVYNLSENYYENMNDFE